MVQVIANPIGPREPRARYDANGDVLYVSVGAPVAAIVDEDDDGVLLRRARTDSHPCGVTVIAYTEGAWDARLEDLVSKMSSFLGVSVPQLRAAIEHALSESAPH